MEALTRLFIERDNERTTSMLRSKQCGAHMVKDGGPALLLAVLQRSAGNQAVNHLPRRYSGVPVQREAAPEEKDAEQAPTVPTRAEVGLEGGLLGEELAGRISASWGGGASLDDGTRAQKAAQEASDALDRGGANHLDVDLTCDDAGAQSADDGAPGAAQRSERHAA